MALSKCGSFVSHLVFPASESADTARERVGDAVFSLFALKLPRFEHAGRTTQGHISIDRWREEDRADTVIDLTADLAGGLVFASVSSPDATHGEAVAKGLAELLCVPDATEHLQHAAAQPRDGLALQRAALAAGSEEVPALRRLIEAALHATEPDMRACATKAAALTAWPSLGPALAAALEAEAEPQLRRFLEVAARKCGAVP